MSEFQAALALFAERAQIAPERFVFPAGATQEAIALTEAALNVRFSSRHREFLRHFDGGEIVGSDCRFYSLAELKENYDRFIWKYGRLRPRVLYPLGQSGNGETLAVPSVFSATEEPAVLDAFHEYSPLSWSPYFPSFSAAVIQYAVAETLYSRAPKVNTLTSVTNAPTADPARRSLLLTAPLGKQDQEMLAGSESLALGGEPEAVNQLLESACDSGIRTLKLTASELTSRMVESLSFWTRLETLELKLETIAPDTFSAFNGFEALRRLCVHGPASLPWTLWRQTVVHLSLAEPRTIPGRLVLERDSDTHALKRAFLPTDSTPKRRSIPFVAGDELMMLPHREFPVFHGEVGAGPEFERWFADSRHAELLTFEALEGRDVAFCVTVASTTA